MRLEPRAWDQIFHFNCPSHAFGLFYLEDLMPPRKTARTDNLKSDLQKRHATRRRLNQEEVQLQALQNSHRRNDLQPSSRTVVKATNSLKPSSLRTRETTLRQLESTMRSIQAFGMVLPILIDQDDQIIAGHALWEAASKLGLEQVECRIIEHLDPVEREALALALNRIGEIGKFNLEKLRDRMIAIESHGIELVSTGFSLPEISQIKLMPLADESADEALAAEHDEDPSIISRFGDLYRLGNHLLLCGDAVEAVSYQTLLGSDQVHLVFSDPPYNCKITGFVSGLGQHKHDDFVQFAGKESDAEFLQFLQAYLEQCRAVLAPGAVAFACMDWRQIDVLLAAGQMAGLHRLNIAVWNKGSGGMGGLYRSAHEFVVVFANGQSAATNNIGLGLHGRDRTNVWTYPGANKIGSSAAKALADHPTPKSVELVVDAILDVTNPKDIVLDPFMGSGTTIIACEQSDRYARGIELDPKYVDRAVRRWENLTGQEAIHEQTSLSFAALAVQRSDEQNAGGLADDQ